MQDLSPIPPAPGTLPCIPQLPHPRAGSLPGGCHLSKVRLQLKVRGVQAADAGTCLVGSCLPALPFTTSLPSCCLNFKASKGHMAWSIFSISLLGKRRCFETPWPFSPPLQGNFHFFQNPTKKEPFSSLFLFSLFFFPPLSLSAKNIQPTREGWWGELLLHRR